MTGYLRFPRLYPPLKGRGFTLCLLNKTLFARTANVIYVFIPTNTKLQIQSALKHSQRYLAQ